MSTLIDYYLTPASPFVYLGHALFVDLARANGASIAVKPVDFGRVLAASGGVPLAQRPRQRQAYRLVELARWSAFLGVPLHLHPRHFPVQAGLASRWILAASEQGESLALDLVGALGRALWAEERDIADKATLAAIATSLRADVAALEERVDAPDIATRFDALTQEAIDRGVFGVPTYFAAGEMFFGQDRLDFLARELAK